MFGRKEIRMWTLSSSVSDKGQFDKTFDEEKLLNQVQLLWQKLERRILSEETHGIISLCGNTSCGNHRRACCNLSVNRIPKRFVVIKNQSCVGKYRPTLPWLPTRFRWCHPCNEVESQNSRKARLKVLEAGTCANFLLFLLLLSKALGCCCCCCSWCWWSDWFSLCSHE